MSISPHEFWGSNHYDHPPLTDEMLAQAEKQLGVALPEDYVALLRIQNGGYTERFGYPMTGTKWSEVHIPLFALGGIVTDPDHRTAHNILETGYLTAEWDLPEKQVLLVGEGHWWITLDYRSGDIPSVAWIDVECEQNLQVAPTFTAFLAGLRSRSHFAE